jgi:hypothetical protein
VSFDPRPFIEHHRAMNEAELLAIQERASVALEEARQQIPALTLSRSI